MAVVSLGCDGDDEIWRKCLHIEVKRMCSVPGRVEEREAPDRQRDQEENSG